MRRIVLVAAALGAAASPSLQSILTKHVPPDAQGELQGALTSLASLMSIGAPFVMTQLFSRFSEQDTGHYLPGQAQVVLDFLTKPAYYP